MPCRTWIRIAYDIVPDFETELVMFKAGETDVHGVLGEEYASLKPLEAEGNLTIYRRGPAIGYHVPRLQHEPQHEHGDRCALCCAGKAGVVSEYAVSAGGSP